LTSIPKVVGSIPLWSGIFFKLAQYGYALRVTSQTNIICYLNYTIIIDKKYNVTSEGIELKTYLISSSELLSSVISPSSSVNIDVLPLPRSIDELYLVKISFTISIYSTCEKLISVGSGIKPIPGTVEQRGKRPLPPPFSLTLIGALTL
jgi:hypothetical protein